MPTPDQDSVVKMIRNAGNSLLANAFKEGKSREEVADQFGVSINRVDEAIRQSLKPGGSDK